MLNQSKQRRANTSLPQIAEALDRAIIANEELASFYEHNDHPQAERLAAFHTARAQACEFKIDQMIRE